MSTLPVDASSPLSPVNVLVVDDVAQNLVAMEALLRCERVQVLKAASGAEALELLLVHDVALALLDVQMPEMDGFALAELMRGKQRTRNVPIVFITASPNDPMRPFKGYESGAVDMLHKPVDPRVVISKVNVFVELYQQRQQLQARNEQLERLLTLNETMIAVLTHDLRTPLSAIAMGSEILKHHIGENAAAAPALKRIKSSTQRMARMIDQLLDFSRLRSDVVRLHPSSEQLSSVADTVIAEIRQANPEAQVALSCTGDLHGTFDSNRMAQVLANLTANAVQHGAAGSVVSVALEGQDPHWLRGSVTNSGRIPEALLPCLFEPFKGSADAPGKGLGLGLYIVDQFIRIHGGRVSAANTAAGVRFQFEIPRQAKA